MNHLIGFFDDAAQAKATYDPGLEVPCIVCYKPLSPPMTTISVMPQELREKSLFYRAHKSCYDGLSEAEQEQIDGSVIDTFMKERKAE